MTASEWGFLALSYLVGAVPFGYILTRLRSGEDIRTKGSGNIGATNVLRTQGAFFGALTLVLDFMKAAVPVILAGRYDGHPWFPALAGGLAVIGHCYPVYIGFRGGKGAASGFGAFLFIAPLPTLIGLGAFIAVLMTTGYVSVSSMTASLVFAGAVWFFKISKGSYDIYTASLATFLSFMLIWRHRSNIRNLLNGRERRIWKRNEKKVG